MLETADIIFMDPPYGKAIEEEVLRVLSGSSILKPDAQIIVEASLNTDLSYLEELGFEIVKCKNYKTNKHIFIRKSR